jgi:hypothetical protein
LQRGIFLLSIGMVAGRRSGVHGVERKEGFAMKCLKNLSELVAEKLPAARFPAVARRRCEALVAALRREKATGVNEG